jgi:RNA polymerase sigma factor (TIGR02999 family)
VNHARHLAANALDGAPPSLLNSCCCEIDSVIYDGLQRLAAVHLRRERPDHLLDPTDLVSEVYLRLVGSRVELADQAHFFAIASRSMSQILVDHARKQLAAKRGCGHQPVELSEAHLASVRPQELVALGDALDELARLDERKARVIVLHYGAGLTREEIARMGGVHANTVTRELRDGIAWLRRRLQT